MSNIRFKCRHNQPLFSPSETETIRLAMPREINRIKAEENLTEADVPSRIKIEPVFTSATEVSTSAPPAIVPMIREFIYLAAPEPESTKPQEERLDQVLAGVPENMACVCNLQGPCQSGTGGKPQMEAGSAGYYSASPIVHESKPPTGDMDTAAVHTTAVATAAETKDNNDNAKVSDQWETDDFNFSVEGEWVTVEKKARPPPKGRSQGRVKKPPHSRQVSKKASAGPRVEVSLQNVKDNWPVDKGKFSRAMHDSKHGKGDLSKRGEKKSENEEVSKNKGVSPWHAATSPPSAISTSTSKDAQGKARLLPIPQQARPSPRAPASDLRVAGSERSEPGSKKVEHEGAKPGSALTSAAGEESKLSTRSKPSSLQRQASKSKVPEFRAQEAVAEVGPIAAQAVEEKCSRTYAVHQDLKSEESSGAQPPSLQTQAPNSKAPEPVSIAAEAVHKEPSKKETMLEDDREHGCKSNSQSPPKLQLPSPSEGSPDSLPELWLSMDMGVDVSEVPEVSAVPDIVVSLPNSNVDGKTRSRTPLREQEQVGAPDPVESLRTSLQMPVEVSEIQSPLSDKGESKSATQLVAQAAPTDGAPPLVSSLDTLVEISEPQTTLPDKCESKSKRQWPSPPPGLKFSTSLDMLMEAPEEDVHEEEVSQVGLSGGADRIRLFGRNIFGVETAESTAGVSFVFKDEISHAGNTKPSCKSEKVGDTTTKSAETENRKVENTKLESADAESIKVENIEVESIEVESIEVESIEVESIEVESIEVESIEVESASAENNSIENKEARNTKEKKPTLQPQPQPQPQPPSVQPQAQPIQVPKLINQQQRSKKAGPKKKGRFAPLPQKQPSRHSRHPRNFHPGTASAATIRVHAKTLPNSNLAPIHQFYHRQKIQALNMVPTMNGSQPHIQPMGQYSQTPVLSQVPATSVPSMVQGPVPAMQHPLGPTAQIPAVSQAPPMPQVPTMSGYGQMPMIPQVRTISQIPSESQVLTVPQVAPVPQVQMAPMAQMPPMPGYSQVPPTPHVQPLYQYPTPPLQQPYQPVLFSDPMQRYHQPPYPQPGYLCPQPTYPSQPMHPSQPPYPPQPYPPQPPYPSQPPYPMQ